MKNKHLTFKDRVLIEDLLNRGNATLTTIAKSFGKDVSTISKEIKKHIVLTNQRSLGALKMCVKKSTCRVRNLGCTNCKHKEGYLCSHCGECEFVCKERDTVCSKRKKPPYVCNGCINIKTCRFEKGFYRAKIAQDQYENELTHSRCLVALNRPETYVIDQIITPAIEDGQSVHHIYVTNKDQISVTERTIYNMLHQDVFTATLVDLPRTAQRKIPKVYKYKRPKDKNVLEGRTYIDFIKYTQNAPYEVLQLDTVIGNPSGAALLTMEFVNSKLLLAFLIKEKTISYVSKVFYNIRQILTKLNLSQHDLMPVILTDNGSEFNSPTDIECDEFGEVLSRVFYCNPNAPFQKGSLENNHTNLRRIFPKGTSFDNLTQEQVNIAISHINSMIRSSCMDKSAYDMFCFMHPNGKDILDAFGISRIDPRNIMLKPEVLKRK